MTLADQAAAVTAAHAAMLEAEAAEAALSGAREKGYTPEWEAWRQSSFATDAARERFTAACRLHVPALAAAVGYNTGGDVAPGREATAVG